MHMSYLADAHKQHGHALCPTCIQNTLLHRLTAPARPVSGSMATNSAPQTHRSRAPRQLQHGHKFLVLQRAEPARRFNQRQVAAHEAAAAWRGREGWVVHVWMQVYR